MDNDKKVVILHNFKREEYLQIIKMLEFIGISNKTIVAVTTPTTLEWKLSQLIRELFIEDEEMKKSNKKNK
ncbi:MAG: DUF3783 domain-containing protein [Thermoplasmata archaeon]